MRSLLPHLLVLLGLLGSGCGHCDGAIRHMSLSWGEGSEIDPTATFRLRGDGPGDEDEALRQASGIDVDTWELLDPDGLAVPAEVSGDSGGHVCRNGVGFDLVPVEPLAPGEHTLVLWLDRIDWPLVGSEADAVEHDGVQALVETFTVVE